MSEDRSGLAAALLSFGLWGLSPAFFKLLQHVPPAVIIGHRVIWASLLLSLFLWWRDGRGFLDAMRLRPRQIAGLLLSALLVSGNWLLFVWAVANGQTAVRVRDGANAFCFFVPSSIILSTLP